MVCGGAQGMTERLAPRPLPSPQVPFGALAHLSMAHQNAAHPRP